MVCNGNTCFVCGGSPRLIVEVKKKVIKLRLVSISYENNEIEIKKTIDDKGVSEDEYIEITSGFIKRRKE